MYSEACTEPKRYFFFIFRFMYMTPIIEQALICCRHFSCTSSINSYYFNVSLFTVQKLIYVHMEVCAYICYIYITNKSKAFPCKPEVRDCTNAMNRVQLFTCKTKVTTENITFSIFVITVKCLPFLYLPQLFYRTLKYPLSARRKQW